VDSTSAPDRESTERSLDVVQGLFVSAVARDRKISEDRLLTANGQLETARAFAATALLIAEAIALYAFFAWLERRVVTWEPKP